MLRKPRSSQMPLTPVHCYLRCGRIFANRNGNATDLVFIKTTASKKGYNLINEFWASFMAGLGNQVQFAISIDVTPENHELNVKHDWSSIPAMGNFIYTGTSVQAKVLDEHAILKTMVQRLRSNSSQAILHVCSEKDMLNSYPALAESAKVSNKIGYPHPLGWGYNYASSLLLWKLLQSQGLRFEHIWEFHDDVRLASAQDLIDLISANKAKPESLLVVDKLDGKKPTDNRWMWAGAGTAAYLASTSIANSSLPKGQSHAQTCYRQATSVWATRTSSELMRRMDQWCGEERKCAWTEQFSQTIAACEHLGLAQMARRDLLQGSGGGPGGGYLLQMSSRVILQSR